MSDVRVRFSPAPTGSLHVGSARTALFNWLFARHDGGTFLLRIEDTDAARSRDEWADGIQDTLRWLGVDWDEEPVRQSSRFARYLEVADELLAAGYAYESFETPDELEAINAERKAAGLPPGYDGRARDLTPAERDALRAEGRPRALRFRTPDEGTSTFEDVVRGTVSVEWSSISDFVIVRSDGAPVFFLANAVDDREMGITHVIRGEDLIDSTHRVLAIRDALAANDRPEYAHLPLIVGADRAKLSKRHGAVALEDFRDRGYLPEALMNYLALLGWAPASSDGEDGREVLGRDELVAAFELERVTHAAAAFDQQKLDWLNGEWIRRLSLDDLVSRIDVDGDPALVRAAVALAQERSVTLNDIVESMQFLLVADDDFEIQPESWEKLVSTERVDEVFDAVIKHVESCDPWTVEAIDFRGAITALELKPRKVMPALYAAIEGRHTGLPLFDSIHLLERESALRRLRAARSRL